MNKAKVDELSAKAKTALANGKIVLDEIKTNFKADEGTVGCKKAQSMFSNLWKSGIAGKVALVATGVIVLLLLSAIFSSVGGSGDRIDEILALAEQSEKKDHNINFCGFFTGMSLYDFKALCKHYQLEDDECKGWSYGSMIGEKCVNELYFSLKGVRKLTGGGSTFDELAQAVANIVGDLSPEVDLDKGIHWFETKTIDGVVVKMKQNCLRIEDFNNKKEPVETPMSAKERNAKIREIDTRMKPLFPKMFDMVEIPGWKYQYLMGKYEVTQEQWEALLGNNPSEHKNPENPVDSIGYSECREFVLILNQLPTVQEAGLIFRVPGLHELLYALKGTNKSSKYGIGLGGVEITRDNLDEYAWYNGTKSHPVGKKKPNAFGLYDALGNVCELCYEADVNSSYFLGGHYADLAGDCEIDHGVDMFSSRKGFRLCASRCAK